MEDRRTLTWIFLFSQGQISFCPVSKNTVLSFWASLVLVTLAPLEVEFELSLDNLVSTKVLVLGVVLLMEAAMINVTES